MIQVNNKRVRIVSCLRGAKESARAKSMAVIIDVFRASSTIVTLLERGVEEIMPVLSIKEALSYKPDWILVGEKGDKKLKGFDFDNSPSTLNRLNWKAKRVVLTTSNGVEGLIKAQGASEILVGCFLNARAVADCVSQNVNEVVLVPIGNKGEKRLEDEMCAQMIGKYIMSQPVDVQMIKRTILHSPIAERLKKRGLRADLRFCLKFNVFNTVPKLGTDMRVRRMSSCTLK